MQANNLIYVLSTSGDIFVLNHTLKNKEDGLVFKFKLGFMQAPLLDFWLVPDSDLFAPQGYQMDTRKVLDPIEKMLLNKNLKPSGKMVTVHQQVINLWDFDQEFDQKKFKCKMLSQLVFSNDSKIVGTPIYLDGVLFLEH